MTRKFLAPIPRKITQKFIDDHAVGSKGHYGSNKALNQTLNVLHSLGTICNEAQFRADMEERKIQKVVPNNTKIRIYPDRFLSFQLYEGVPDPRDILEWQKHSSKRGLFARIEKLRCGEASVLHDEGDHFHTGWRYGLGEDWAEKIDAHRLATENIYDLIRECVRDGMLFPWQEMDPFACFHFLSKLESNENKDIFLSIEPYSEDRLSRQRRSDRREVKLIHDVDEYSKGTEFQLQVRGLDDEESILAVEFSRSPFTVNGSDEKFRGQIMRYSTIQRGRRIVEGEGGEPLEISQPPGEYGFCVVSGYQVQELKEALNWREFEDFITTEQLQTLAETFRKMSFEDNADLALNVINFRVT